MRETIFPRSTFSPRRLPNRTGEVPMIGQYIHLFSHELRSHTVDQGIYEITGMTGTLVFARFISDNAEYRPVRSFRRVDFELRRLVFDPMPSIICRLN